MLVGSDQNEVFETGERLCRLVAGHAFKSHEGNPLACTVSMGLAVWNDEEAVDKLLNRADDALYEAKRSGRNQVRLAEFC